MVQRDDVTLDSWAQMPDCPGDPLGKRRDRHKGDTESGRGQ
jgi:hypothetical protein